MKRHLKTLLQRALHWADPDAERLTRFPVEELRAQKDLHERSPMNLHMDILYGDLRIGEVPVLDLFNRCVRDTNTFVSPWKTFARVQGIANLARYFLRSLDIDGARAECGVLQGLSALFLCHVGRQNTRDFKGADLHLIDSFEGFPEPRQEDFIPIRLDANRTGHAPAFGQGEGAVSVDHVQRLFREFPEVQVHRGFIPQVFTGLKEARWAFVHIDVDLHKATLDCLEYFHPRMAAGGIIVCDDYGSKLFPGAHKAWDSYCEANGIPFVVLDTGQSVLIK